MYDIRFERSTKTLHVSAEGFWSVAVVTGFMTELIAKATAIRIRHGRFVALVDLRKGAIHSAATVAILETMTPRALRITQDPVAVVVPSVLAKMQTGRYMKGDNCRLFLDIGEAQEWLEDCRAVVA